MSKIRRLMIILAGFCLPVWGQGPNASFEQVLGTYKMSNPENTVKITWVGLQSESVSTVAFATGTLPDLSIFTPYRTPGIFYNNDDAESDWLFSVSDAEMNQVLVNLSQLPAVVAGGIQGITLSISVYLKTNDPTNPFVFEVILDSIDSAAALRVIAAGLDPNNPGVVHVKNLVGIVKGT